MVAAKKSLIDFELESKGVYTTTCTLYNIGIFALDKKL